ncbi:MAG: adenosine deaminase [Fusobacteriaceae bacterium]|nr:adenosine deaminase [Fusobacteriaceae bacterium]
MDSSGRYKIDLHCHLDGSLSLETIKKIIKNDKLPKDDRSIFKLLQVSDICKNLTEYLEKFDLPLEGLQTKENLELAGYNLIKDVSKENVKYIEVRFAPMLSCNYLKCSDVIEAVIIGVKKAEKEFDIMTNIIVCAMRHHTYETNFAMLKSACGFLGKGVCALDLAGDEIKFPTKLHVELFKSAKRFKIPFTIHSGETGDIENIRLALELGASRLGHGIALIKDEKLMRDVYDNNIGIEMCPTSNLQTKAVDNLNNYPMKEYLKKNLLVSINTDNRTVSNTNSTNEIEIVKELYKKDYPELEKILYMNAVKTSFAEDRIKDKLIMLYK